MRCVYMYIYIYVETYMCVFQQESVCVPKKWVYPAPPMDPMIRSLRVGWHKMQDGRQGRSSEERCRRCDEGAGNVCVCVHDCSTEHVLWMFNGCLIYDDDIYIYIYMRTWLVVTGTRILLSHLLGMSSSQPTNSYFSEGWLNHQPVNIAR